MTRWLVGGWLLLGVAFAVEQAPHRFAWPSDGELRVLTSWEVVVTAPDGRQRRMSGMTRGGWVWSSDGERVVLRQRPAKITHVTPLTDEVAGQIAQALAEAWEVELDQEGRPRLAEPAPMVEAPPEAVGDAAVPSVVEAPAPGMVTAAGALAEPSVAVDQVVAPPPEVVDVDATQLIAWLVPRPEAAFADVYGSLANSLTVGASVRHLADKDLEVSRTLSEAPWCPTEGPGTRCVVFEQVRAAGGASVALPPEQPGQRVAQERWVLTAEGARPEQLSRDVKTVWLGLGGTWRAHMTQEVRFLPERPPGALAR